MFTTRGAEVGRPLGGLRVEGVQCWGSKGFLGVLGPVKLGSRALGLMSLGVQST